MRTRFTRLVCMILALVTLLSLVVACTEPGEGNTTTAPNATTTAPEGGATTSSSETEAPEDTRLPDEISALPDNLSFEGETFTMLLRSDRAYALEEFCVEYDNTSNIVQTAVYARQQKIEENLGITFDYVSMTEGDLYNYVNNTAATNDYEFDVACPAAYQVGGLCTEGILGDWYDVEYVDFSKVWWGSRTNLVDRLTINDKMYVISGDASNMSLGKVLCMYFNKNLLEVYGNIKADEMYKIVLDGEWTIDRLTEISKGISRDTNGDDEIGPDDLFGCNFYLATIADNYFAAFDIPIIAKENDEYKLVINSPKMITAIEKLQELCWGSGQACYLTKDKGSSQTFFKNNHAAFTHGGLEWANEMSDMTDDFGIIPYPKFDLEQQRYQSTLSDVYTAFVYIAGYNDIEKLGAVMEMIGSISYETTTVAYYETVLKGQAARDPDSWTTMDLIHDSITYDMGILFSSAIGRPNEAFRTLLSSGTASWSSYWAGKSTMFNKMMEKLIKSFD